jgi:RNA polymerase sigma factor (sigma-70 family)
MRELQPEESMPNRPLEDVVHFLRRVVTPPGSEVASDSELLDRFVNQRDEDAFELLVWRHSAAVLAECYRILRNECDAEDAFQATFLVLDQKARSIRKGASLGAWLLKVAFRIALAARGRADQYIGRQRPLTDVAGEPEGDRADYRAEQDEVCSVIDAEVNRLPEKYRLPIVLCYYQGKSNEEAARELGRPLGTVQSNLSRGRNLLRARLARRGVTLSAGLFAAAITPTGGTAAVAPELVLGTVNAALAGRAAWAGMLPAKVTTLAKAGLSSLAANKLHWGAAVLVGLIVAGTGVGLGVVGAPGVSENRDNKVVLEQPPQTQASVEPPQPPKRRDDGPVGQTPQAKATPPPLDRAQARVLIKEFYRRILERDDREEGNGYVEDLVEGKRDPVDVAWEMARSEEYKQNFLKDATAEDSVRDLYAKLFQREPSDEEVEMNATFYRFLGWKDAVWYVLSSDRGKTYAGQIRWSPTVEAREWLNGHGWTGWLAQVRQALMEKPRDRK